MAPDAYALLGLPDGPRPPSHYELLGVDVDESSAAVISKTAQKRITQLQAIPWMPVVEMRRLTDEIKLAQACLIDPISRARYDEWLLAARGSKTDEAGGQEPTAGSGASGRPPITPRRKLELILILAAILNAAFALACWLWFAHRQEVAQLPLGGAGESSAKETVVVQDRQISPPPTTDRATVDLPSEATDTATVPTDDLVTDSEPSPRDSASVELPIASTDDATVPSENRPPEPQPAPTASADPPEPDTDDAAPPPADVKLPVPSKEECQKALASIRSLHGAELDAAAASVFSPIKRKAAQRLAAMAAEEQTPANRFVLLVLAREFAMKASRFDVALQYAERMSNQFDVDLFTAKWEVLEQFPAASHTNPEYRQALRQFCWDAQEAEQFQMALLAMNPLHSYHADPELWNVPELAKAAKAQAALKADPDNAEASQALGEYLCFALRHWDTGLPHLAKSGPNDFSDAVAADLADPTDPVQQLRVADRWWEIAQHMPKQRQTEAASIRARASFWYQRAIGAQ
jgi:hypothetical protein